MTDFTKLVVALRCKRDDCEGCDLAFLDNDEGWMCRYAAKDDDAADAIEELQAKLEQCTLFNTNLLNMREMSKEEVDEILEYIRNAPIGPIEPMQIEQLPKRGEWVHRADFDYMDMNEVEHSHFMCDKCGFIHDFLDGHVSQYNYCPNCGAKMEVQDESVF